MRFSTFHIMSQRPGTTGHEIIQESLREIDLSEHLGFDNVWLTEHHGTAYGLCSSPSVLAAAVAMRTRKLGIGYAANVTPLHHPLRLAEEIALVDQLSEGRVLAGFGTGYSPYEFSLYGTSFEQRYQKHRAILEIVVRAWTQESFSYDGEGYHFEGATVSLRPYQQPHPPIVIAASSPETIQEAARAGHRVMVLGSVEAIVSKIETYRQAVQEGSHSQAQSVSCLQNIGALRQILVTDRSDWSLKAIEAATAWHIQQTKQLSAPVSNHEQVAQEEISQYVHGRITAGSPEVVVERLLQLQAKGVGEVLCWFKWGEITHEQAIKSMKLFSESVIPHFR